MGGLREETSDGHTLAGNGPRQDLNVADISYSVQRLPKGQQAGTKLTPNARLQRRRNIQEMNGQAAAFVFDPDIGISLEGEV